MRTGSNCKCCIPPNCKLETESEIQTATRPGLLSSGELEHAPPGGGLGAMGTAGQAAGISGC